ncbi:hypothetical protein BT63DRAFT_422490 [Microthyrium microscopicum]|uniref:Uncharacterized protein n=1 Tax=Microthyrium microscopicum TaxID=703497 RepID=A0A6A6UKK2_9PEZI|nr:hypothetical protein BT63DRAFT_422490 [Microthyrium microscopicum]
MQNQEKPADRDGTGLAVETQFWTPPPPKGRSTEFNTASGANRVELTHTRQDSAGFWRALSPLC